MQWLQWWTAKRGQEEEEPTPKRPRTQSASASSSSGRAGGIDLSWDAFDCLICRETMLGRIFQCPSGHSVCEDCLVRLRSDSDNCPNCKQQYATDPTRNLAMEGLAARCQFPCRFGCGMHGGPAELLKHQSSCTMRPRLCPVAACKHKCAIREMHNHLCDMHNASLPALCKEGVVPVAHPFKFRLHAMSIKYAHGVVVALEDAPLLFHDRCVRDGTFLAKVSHFETPVRYNIEIRQGQRSLTITGPSQDLSDTGGEIQCEVAA
mmetsp:Transcript_37006/g.106342  ORF Transcript_37006/g.106342 Transcript_37006/m.106342 type:complete len:263 (-) Transcript_37006:86-874(-)